MSLLGFIFVLAFAGAVSYKYYKLNQYSLKIEADFSQAKSNLEQTSKELKNTIVERDDLSQKLEAEKKRMDNLAGQVAYLQRAIGLIEKVHQTDKELLQKYSRVYFLNENYMPDSLSKIKEEFLYNTNKDMYLHTKVMPFFENLMQDAASDGVDIKVISAYRSFGEQASLKHSYKMIYGAGANKFSADQGYSEHQLGTTVDFTSSALGVRFDKFDKTPASEWLLKNAYKYGFILSYPKDNSYYYFEPWHWRFVGRKLAERLHKEGKYFYDLDQREINKYIIYLFE